MAALSTAFAQIPADRFEPVRAVVRQQMLARSAASVTVAIAKNGEVLWEESWGWADRERRIPATLHTPYSLASITKTFTGTALMILRERGKLDLDRPINDYLGDAKIQVRLGSPRDLTVRRVANHTAGLPLHYQFFYEGEPYHAPSRDETILRYANTVSVPGERFQYSNLGYGILDHVISRVSGQPYEDFLRTEVFIPLGMTRSSVGLTPPLREHAATRYDTEGKPLPYYTTDDPGGGEVFSSAHDLMRYASLHLKLHRSDQAAILKDASLDEMHRPTTKAEMDWEYGVGWRTRTHPSGHKILFHTGSMGGVSTILALLPAERIAVTILTNSNNTLTGQSTLPYVVLDSVLAALYPNAPRSPAAAPAADVAFAPRELTGIWIGLIHTYAGDRNLRLEFRSDGLVLAQLDEQLATLVNRPAWKGGFFTGSMMGDIGTADSNRRPYDLQLNLKVRKGPRLNGGTIAITRRGPIPGNALAHWTELRRIESNDSQTNSIAH